MATIDLTPVKKGIWFVIRSILATVFSLFAIFFTYITIAVISLLQMTFLPKRLWVNPFPLWERHRFTGFFCDVVCSLVIYTIVYMSHIQQAIEHEFCVRKEGEEDTDSHDH